MTRFARHAWLMVVIAMSAWVVNAIGPFEVTEYLGLAVIVAAHISTAFKTPHSIALQ